MSQARRETVREETPRAIAKRAMLTHPLPHSSGRASVSGEESEDLLLVSPFLISRMLPISQRLHFNILKAAFGGDKLLQLEEAS